MEKRKRYWLVGGVLIVILILGFIALLMPGPDYRVAEGIAVIRIEGVITSSSPGLFMEGASAPGIVSLIRKASVDERVKGLLIAINSPGGSAAGSQEIYRELERFREKDKVVVASLGDSAASGAYYIASMADFIIANPATMTGSIGAVMEFMEISEMLDKLGVKAETFKSGEMKDAGSLFRPMEPEEGEYFQALLDEVHEQFVLDVVKGRNLSREEIEEIADGRVVLGSQALEKNLIDGLGNFSDALEKLGELTGLDPVPRVIELERRSFWEQFLRLESINLQLPGEWDFLQYFLSDSYYRQLRILY